MKLLRTLSLALFIGVCAQSTAQAFSFSSLFTPITASINGVAGTANLAAESWDALPGSTKKLAIAVTGLVVYHNYGDFLKNEGNRRRQLFSSITKSNGISKDAALKEAAKCRCKFCPVKSSQSVRDAVDSFYAGGKNDIEGLKDALCPEWKPFWLLSTYF